MLGASGCAEHLGDYDRRLFVLLNTGIAIAALDWVMLLASNAWSALLLVPLFALHARDHARRWWHWALIALGMLLLVGAVDGSASALKRVVGRPRPCQVIQDARVVVPCSGSPSLPSNHAANTFALAAFATACLRTRARLWFGLAAVVGYSRIHLGVHYPIDVLTGAAWGTVLGWVAAMGGRRLANAAR